MPHRLADPCFTRSKPKTRKLPQGCLFLGGSEPEMLGTQSCQIGRTDSLEYGSATTSCKSSPKAGGLLHRQRFSVMPYPV